MEIIKKTARSGRIAGGSWGRELLLTFVATTLSIILTFGTAEFIEYKKKVNAGRQMVMFIIHDLEESLRLIDQTDGQLRELSEVFSVALQHKDSIDRIELIGAASHCMGFLKFSETAEHIFNSNPETWKNIGNVHFIDNVSEAYILRHSFVDNIHDAIKEDWEKASADETVADQVQDDDAFVTHIVQNIDVDYYVLECSTIAYELRTLIAELKQMMDVSDDDLTDFAEQYTPIVSKAEKDSVYQTFMDEYVEKSLPKNP